MTPTKLSYANDLNKEISVLEELLSSVDNARCEWIEFNSGNGRNAVNVCNDSDIIKLVRKLITIESTLKLGKLQRKFGEL